MNYFYQFLSLTLILRLRKLKKLKNVNLSKKLRKNFKMFPTNICISYELPETMLLFGLRYLHLDFFQFLQPYLSSHVQFCSYVFQSKKGSYDATE